MHPRPGFRLLDAVAMAAIDKTVRMPIYKTVRAIMAWVDPSVCVPHHAPCPAPTNAPSSCRAGRPAPAAWMHPASISTLFRCSQRFRRDGMERWGFSPAPLSVFQKARAVLRPAEAARMGVSSGRPQRAPRARAAHCNSNTFLVPVRSETSRIIVQLGDRSSCARQ